HFQFRIHFTFPHKCPRSMVYHYVRVIVNYGVSSNMPAYELEEVAGFSAASNSSMLHCGLRPRASCNCFQLIAGRPVSNSTMLMQPGTGQTSAQRLQPTHSSSTICGTCFSATPSRR